MKKLITFLTSITIMIGTISMPLYNIRAAGCNHRYSSSGDVCRNLDGRKHTVIRTCTKCGYQKTITKNHVKGTKIDTVFKDSKKHIVKYDCTKCEGTYDMETTHSFGSSKDYKKIDNTYHNEIKTCNCGYEQKTMKKHNTTSGSCKDCGHNNADGLGGAEQRGAGECGWLIASSYNDNWIYSSCPKCGSTSSSFYKRKVIRKNVAVVGGSKVTIYHQQVKCNNGNCNKKYWNRCYYEYQ